MWPTKCYLFVSVLGCNTPPNISYFTGEPPYVADDSVDNMKCQTGYLYPDYTDITSTSQCVATVVNNTVISVAWSPYCQGMVMLRNIFTA